ncbi:MAG TPA: hypothetical protein VGX23_23980 [Actinocrinis sp.]|nr:hypothetical protein [Actinocrinis sp.]
MIDDQDVVTTMWIAQPLTLSPEPAADIAPQMPPVPAPPAMSALEVAWSAVRGCQRSADLPGLILAQMALELVDGAARRNA